MKRSKTEFTILKAFNGDCILIKTFNSQSDEFIILIDGGTPSTFEYSLKPELRNLSKIDLLVLTHIDSDHIGGLLKLFNNSLIDRIDISEIWVNNPDLINVNSGGLIGFDQANKFKDLIVQKKGQAIIKEISTSERFIVRDNVFFTILSPTKDILDLLYQNWEYDKPKNNIKINVSSDTNIGSYEASLEELSNKAFAPIKTIEQDIVNASSIAFILSCPDMIFLLLGDSRAEIVEKELSILGYARETPLECDYVKLSHHGSKNNTSENLLELLNSTNYIISTNGGSVINKHPSREVIAKIVYNAQRKIDEELHIFMNYSVPEIKNRIGCFINDNDLDNGDWTIEQKNNF